MALMANLTDFLGLWKGMSRVEINKYLATRSDLLPYCNNCEKKVDMMKFIASNLLRFKCHSAVVDEHVSNAIVRSQDKMYDYLAALPEKKVFKLTMARARYIWHFDNLSYFRPHCQQCNRRVDATFSIDGTMNYRCHGESRTSYVPSSALESKEKFTNYAMELADVKLFYPQVSAYAQSQNFLNGVSSVSCLFVISGSFAPFNTNNTNYYQPSYHPPAQPKPKQPKLTPLLPTDHVPRAITFDD